MRLGVVDSDAPWRCIRQAPKLDQCNLMLLEYGIVLDSASGTTQYQNTHWRFKSLRGFGNRDSRFIGLMVMFLDHLHQYRRTSTSTPHLPTQNIECCPTPRPARRVTCRAPHFVHANTAGPACGGSYFWVVKLADFFFHHYNRSRLMRRSSARSLEFARSVSSCPVCFIFGTSLDTREQ